MNLKNHNRLKTFGIEVYEREIKADEIKNNPPVGNFVVFSFNKKGNYDEFLDEILKNEAELEKLPYRVFVKLPKNCSWNIEDSLLKKRICIIDDEKFKKLTELLSNPNEDPRKSIVYLYKLWITHLIDKCDNFKKNGIKFKIYITNVAESSSLDAIEKAKEKYPLLKKYFEDVLSREEAGSEVKPNIILSNDVECEIHFNNPNLPKNRNNKKIILYRRHHGKNILKENKDIFYYESFSGSSMSYSILTNWPTDEFEKIIQAYKLVENSLLNIVIVDERICKKLSIPEDENPLLQYKTRGIFPVGYFEGDKIVNIRENKTLFKLILKNENVEFKFENKKLEINKPTILLIHQGILDKAFENNSKKALTEKIKKLKTLFPYIVVTSGRGRPSNVPTNVKFILLSNVMQNFRSMKDPDKLGLIHTLINLKEK